MGQYDFLLGAQPIKTPGPLETATSALTLGDLMNRQALTQQQLQVGQFSLQGAQQTAAATPEFMQRLGKGEDINSVMADIAQKYPLAAPKLIGDYKAQQLTQAQIEEAKGKASEATSGAFAKAVPFFFNAANDAATTAASGQPPTLAQQKAMHFYGTVAAKYGGIDPAALALPPTTDQGGDPDAWAKAAQVYAKIGTTPEAAATIAVKQTEVPKNQAEAFKTLTEANLAGFKAQSERMTAQAHGVSAGAAAAQANTAAQKFAYGEVLPNQLTGGVTRVAPTFVNGRVVGAEGAPISGAGGGPLQTGPTIGQTNALAEQKPIIAASAATISSAQKGIQLVDQFTALASNPNTLSGPLYASEAGRAILGTLSSMGIGTEKWANAKASEVFTQEMLGPLVHELGARGGVGLTKLVGLGKPDFANDPVARQAMSNALKQQYQNDIQTNTQKLTYMQQHAVDDPLALRWSPPAPVSATSFTAGPRSAGPITGQTPQMVDPTKIDPAAMRGKLLVAPDGTKYRPTVDQAGRWTWARIAQ